MIEVRPGRFQKAVHCLQRGQLASARDICREILKRQPDHADALHALGICNRASAQQALGALEAALDSYNQAIVIDGAFAEAHFNRGIVLRTLNRLEESVASHSRAAALRPDFANAYYHRGLALHELNQLEASLASYDLAIAMDPTNAEAHCNRGIVLRDLNRLDAALASYDRALAINPRYAEVHSNRGNVLRDLQQWDAALASYDAATAIRPDLAEAHCNKAVALLLAGELDKGWVHYTWRLERESRRFTQPLWLGKEPIAGKVILIHSEQGFGDTLQFCRYVSMVANLRARVVFEVQSALSSVMTHLEGVTELVEKGSTLPPFDFHCPLLSLPLAFNTTLATIPATRRYLRSDETTLRRWQTLLGEKTRPRIGLVWAGSTLHRNNNRSLSLADWLPYLPPGFQYISLQKEVQALEAELLRTHPEIAVFTEELHDFGETAALCDCLDLVVSIDTGVAHLSAALGKETWVLLPFNPDWRWLLDREDSPWYPSATLFRQTSLGDWDGVLQGIRDKLIHGPLP